MGGLNAVERLRFEDIGMNRVTRRARDLIVHAPRKDLRTQPAMNEPLLVPARLQHPGGHLAQQRRDLSSAEGSEADLRLRFVGIGLEQEIDVDPLRAWSMRAFGARRCLLYTLNGSSILSDGRAASVS